MNKTIKKLLGYVRGSRDTYILQGFSKGYKTELQQDLGIYLKNDTTTETEKLISLCDRY